MNSEPASWALRLYVRLAAGLIAIDLRAGSKNRASSFYALLSLLPAAGATAIPRPRLLIQSEIQEKSLPAE